PRKRPGQTRALQSPASRTRAPWPRENARARHARSRTPRPARRRPGPAKTPGPDTRAPVPRVPHEGALAPRKPPGRPARPGPPPPARGRPGPAKTPGPDTRAPVPRVPLEDALDPRKRSGQSAQSLAGDGLDLRFGLGRRRPQPEDAAQKDRGVVEE